MFLYKKGKIEEIKEYDEPVKYHIERINFLVDNDETESFKKTNTKLYNTVYEVIPLTREQTYKYHRRELVKFLGYEPSDKDDIRETKFTFDIKRVAHDFKLITPRVYENGELPVNYKGDFIIHDFDIKKGEEAGMLSFLGINRKFTNIYNVSKYLYVNGYEIIRVIYLQPYFRYILIGRGFKGESGGFTSKITDINNDIIKAINNLSSKFNINLMDIVEKRKSNRYIFNIVKETENKTAYGRNYNVSDKRANDIKGILDSIGVFKDPIYLDIGSNTGENTIAIGNKITKKENIYGIDNYDEDFMGKKIIHVKELQALTYRDDKIPLRDGEVDIITILQTLHHIKDIDNIMNEISRITHKGSIVIIREHSCLNKNYRYIIDIEHLLYSGREVDEYEEFERSYYANYFSEDEIDKIFNKYNFRKINIPVKYSTVTGSTRYYYAAYIRY